MAADRTHRDEKRSAGRRRSDAAPAAPTAAPGHPLQRLQRQIGNAAVARMLARQPAPEEDEEGTLQASPEVGLAGGPVSDALAGRINRQRGQGAALDAGLRANMEGALATSFEDVRVHTGAESQQLNRSISAKAFTTGNDIFLGQNASPSDQSLMAHELTHVVQQRSMPTGGPMTVGPADDAYEHQAEGMAAQTAQRSGTAAEAEE